MMIEGLELYEETSIMANEQFAQLTKQEQDLYVALKKSKGIDYALSRYGEHNSIINFKTKDENGVVYFDFEIVEAVGIKYHPTVLFKVSGSVLENSAGKNIVYTIRRGKDIVCAAVYVDNYTNIDRNIVLNEITYIDTKANTSRVESVKLTIYDMSKQDKKIIIEPDSDIYKLYFSKQIDIITLCNMALLQATDSNSKVIEDGKTSFTKLLGKRFI